MLECGGGAWCASMYLCKLLESSANCWRERLVVPEYDEVLELVDRQTLWQQVVQLCHRYYEAICAVVAGRWDTLVKTGVLGESPLGAPFSWWLLMALAVSVMHLIVYWLTKSPSQKWARTLFPLMFVLSALVPWSFSVQLLTIWMASWAPPLALMVGGFDFLINWAGLTWISGWLLYPVFALCCTWDWFLVLLGFPKPEAPGYHQSDNILRIITVFVTYLTFSHSLALSLGLVAYIAFRYVYVMARGPLQVTDVFVTGDDGQRKLVSHNYVYRGITGWSWLDHWINPAFGLGLGKPPTKEEMKEEAKKELQTEFDRKLEVLSSRLEHQAELDIKRAEEQALRAEKHAEEQAKRAEKYAEEQIKRTEERLEREQRNHLQKMAVDFGRRAKEAKLNAQREERTALLATQKGLQALARHKMDAGASDLDASEEQVAIMRETLASAKQYNAAFPEKVEKEKEKDDILPEGPSRDDTHLQYRHLVGKDQFLIQRVNQFPNKDSPIFEYTGPCAVVYLWKMDGSYAGTGALIENHIQTIDHNVVLELNSGRDLFATQAFNPTAMRQLKKPVRVVGKIYQFPVPVGFNLTYQLQMVAPKETTGLCMVMGIPDLNPLGKEGGIVCSMGSYYFNEGDDHRTSATYSSDAGMSGSPVCPAVGTGPQRSFGRKVMGLHENGGQPNEFYRYTEQDIQALRGQAVHEVSHPPEGGKGKTKIGRGQLRSASAKIAKQLKAGGGSKAGMRHTHFWSKSLGGWVDYDEVEREFESTMGHDFPDEQDAKYTNWSEGKRKAYREFMQKLEPADQYDAPAYPDEPEFWAARDDLEEQHQAFDQRARVRVQGRIPTGVGSGGSNWADEVEEEEDYRDVVPQSPNGKTKLPAPVAPTTQPAGHEISYEQFLEYFRKKEEDEVKANTLANAQTTTPQVSKRKQKAKKVAFKQEAPAPRISKLKPKQTVSTKAEQDRVNAVAKLVFQDAGVPRTPPQNRDVWTATTMPSSLWNALQKDFKQSFVKLTVEEKKKKIRQMRQHLDGQPATGGVTTDTPNPANEGPSGDLGV